MRNVTIIYVLSVSFIPKVFIIIIEMIWFKIAKRKLVKV